jgi:hypothetical protein
VCVWSSIVAYSTAFVARADNGLRFHCYAVISIQKAYTDKLQRDQSCGRVHHHVRVAAKDILWNLGPRKDAPCRSATWPPSQQQPLSQEITRLMIIRSFCRSSPTYSMGLVEYTTPHSTFPEEIMYLGMKGHPPIFQTSETRLPCYLIRAVTTVRHAHNIMKTCSSSRLLLSGSAYKRRAATSHLTSR